MVTIDDIIAMKKQKMSPYENKYNWFFLNIENDLINKSDGKKRVKSFLSEYDDQARLYVVHQFMKFNNAIGNELFDVLELDRDNTFLDKKYTQELLSSL